MKATIKDVAKAAGVSPSTVSRALHNNPRISKAARERIKQIAADMGFRPNQMASSLVKGESRVIGVVFPANLKDSLAHPFYPKVLQGLGQVAAERGYYVLLGTGTEEQTAEEVVLHLADSGYVSGMVMLVAQEDRQTGSGMPTVVIGRPAGEDSCHFVDNNNYNVGKEAAQYLMDRGHKKIMLLGHDPKYVVTSDRSKGYEAALRENGIAVNRDWIVPSRFLDNYTDQDLLLSIFRKEDRPTAVVCMDDAQAIALTACLASLGLSVPGDVSLISFNNTEAGRLHSPALTSYDVDPYRLGAAAMEMLLSLLAGEKTPRSMDIPFLLMERDSVQPIGGN